MQKNKPEKERVLTGDRPTGPLHLGHYIGSLAERLKLQERYETFILIADIQALTDNFDNPQKVQTNVGEVLLDYLSVGIDPAKSSIVLQSAVPELAELTMFFMNLVTLSHVEQNPTVKSEIERKNFKGGTPLGFLTYPVSQAADIAIFKANLVPVGEDQLPMIEQTREIVRRFNRYYGEILIEPKAIISKFPRLPGTDGKEKMSKSLGNAINLSDDQKTVEKKVRGMYTDPTRVHANDPGHVEGNPVFTYLDAFSENKTEIESLKARYREGKVSDIAVKDYLAAELDKFLTPIRARRAKFAQDSKGVLNILKEGTKKGRTLAQETIASVKSAIGLNYFT